jgi:hypothetical protein
MGRFCMTRTTRLSSAALVAAGLLSLAACSDDVSASAEAVSSAPTSAAPEYYNVPPQVADTPYNRDAARLFGDATVVAAYDEAVQFASTAAFEAHRAFTPQAELSIGDFADVLSYLTPSSAAQFTDAVKQALAEDTTGPATQNVSFTAMFSATFTGHTVGPRSDGLLTDGTAISSPQIWVDDKQRLVVSFHHQTSIHFTVDGRPAHSVYDRDIQYPMVPAPAGSKYPWLIDEEGGSGYSEAAVMDDGSPLPTSTIDRTTSASSNTP